MDRISRHSWLGSITPDSDNDDLPNFDQIVQLMEVVNSMVKGGQFTPQLANAIFALCQQLKQHGPTLEQTHKSDLNKVFVSLRQACCRDHGQLGTPCRLKIMELVELRAMHWRSNLAHSQYYVNRPEQLDSLGASSPLSMGFPTQSMTPTTFSPSLFLPDMTTQTTQAAHQTSPYFLIPAAVPGGFMNPLLPGLLQQPLFTSALAQNQAAAEVLLRNKQIKKPNVAKPMQLRHEMIIRNADSGKIMGVKGRRVALVEQITNTVISFQKVDPKAKERTLTITASTTEAIEHAKQLVEDTIRRNTSPVRPEAAALLGIGHSMSTDSPSMGDDESSDDEDDTEPQRGQDISIETTQDGVLKLCCSDPHVLQAAQEALSEYLRMRTRPSAEEREKKKERRKSMPLQTAVKEEKVETTERRPGLERARSLGGSTPNLQEQAHKAAMASRMRAPFGPCYGREALLAQQQHPGENNEIINQVINHVSQIAPEILRDPVQN